MKRCWANDYRPKKRNGAPSFKRILSTLSTLNDHKRLQGVEKFFRCPSSFEGGCGLKSRFIPCIWRKCSSLQREKRKRGETSRALGRHVKGQARFVILSLAPYFYTHTNPIWRQLQHSIGITDHWSLILKKNNWISLLLFQFWSQEI